MEDYHTLRITVSNYSAVFATHIMTYLSARNMDNFKYAHIIYFGLRSLCSLQRIALCDAPRGSTANFKTSALAEGQ